MVCGGQQCEAGERPCNNGQACYKWTPRENRWTEIASLLVRNKW